MPLRPFTVIRDLRKNLNLVATGDGDDAAGEYEYVVAAARKGQGISLLFLLALAFQSVPTYFMFRSILRFGIRFNPKRLIRLLKKCRQTKP